jgi:peroxiredoxin
MTLTHTPVCKFGEKAPDFRLLGTDGLFWSLQDCLGAKGLLVMFICNHCPYVKAINHKLVRDTEDLRKIGINSVAIMPNDAEHYPEDSLQNMRLAVRDLGYSFPYLIDETQDVARAFGAVCTPDFFGYNSNLELQYRGRMDQSGANRDLREVPRDLFLAMQLVAETGSGPQQQIPSMGCSIKWRQA